MPSRPARAHMRMLEEANRAKRRLPFFLSPLQTTLQKLKYRFTRRNGCSTLQRSLDFCVSMALSHFVLNVPFLRLMQKGHPGLLFIASYLGTLCDARVAKVAIHHLAVVPHQLARPSDGADVGRRIATVWTRPLLASTPMWLFMPKYH